MEYVENVDNVVLDFHFPFNTFKCFVRSNTTNVCNNKTRFQMQYLMFIFWTQSSVFSSVRFALVHSADFNFLIRWIVRL